MNNIQNKHLRNLPVYYAYIRSRLQSFYVFISKSLFWTPTSSSRTVLPFSGHRQGLSPVKPGRFGPVARYSWGDFCYGFIGFILRQVLIGYIKVEQIIIKYIFRLCHTWSWGFKHNSFLYIFGTLSCIFVMSSDCKSSGTSTFLEARFIKSLGNALDTPEIRDTRRCWDKNALFLVSNSVHIPYWRKSQQ